MSELGIKHDTRICRLCLALTKTSFSLIEDNGVSGMLEALTSLKILPSDGISTVMCLKCHLNLKLAFSIQQKMLKAEQRFREGQLFVSIKQEYENENVEPNENINIEVVEEQEEQKLEHSCDLCGKKWPSERILLKHKKAIHVVVECKYCGTKLKAGSYKRHLRQKHSVESETLPVFTCDICGVKESSRKVLNIHKDEVHGVRICPICKKDIGKEVLKDHMLVHGKVNEPNLRKKQLESEASLRIHTCDICGKDKLTKPELTRHNYSVHMKAKCPICKKTFTQPNIKRHIERHSNLFAVCELCGVSVVKQDLGRHMKNVHAVHKLKCAFCDKSFKKTYDRTLHEKREHLDEANYICDTCGKRFYSPRRLRKHIEGTHLKLRPHICEFCNVGFSSKFALKTHRRQHTDERPFKCEFCGEGFRQNVSLKSHLKSQHKVVEELTCECDVCGKKFASGVALKSHRRIHV